MEITRIGLLSVEEFNTYKSRIKPLSNNYNWWLRSPGWGSVNHNVTVAHSGGVSYMGCGVNNGNVSVRPALWLNKESPHLQIGYEFNLWGYAWTMIAEGLALCDHEFCRRTFRDDWKAYDANSFEVSDVKAYLDCWLKRNMPGSNMEAPAMGPELPLDATNGQKIRSVLRVADVRPCQMENGAPGYNIFLENVSNASFKMTVSQEWWHSAYKDSEK